jgi:hypothetical protein
MKKLLVLLLLPLSALAASITLSTGAACDYTGITFNAGGSATVQCVNVATVVVVPPVVPPVVVPPPVVTPPTTCSSTAPGAFGGTVTGPCKAGDMTAGQWKEAPFTVPEGWKGYVEVGISGQNLRVFIDGVEFAGGQGTYDMKPGNHVLRVTAVATAAGSIDLYHYPQ